MGALKLGVVAMVVVGLSCVLPRAEARRIMLADLDAEVALWDADVALSPDGKRIALIVTRADLTDDRFVRSLRLIDVVTGEQRELAPGRASVASPQWSADGERLAWLDTAADGATQIHLRALDGAAGTLILTDAPEGVTSFRWSPDGQHIAFVTPDPSAKGEGAERHNRSFEVTEANDFLSVAAIGPSHLWVIPAAGGVARRLTSGVDGVDGMAWLRDGSIACLIRSRSSLNAVLSRVNVDDGRSTVLVPGAASEPTATLLPASPDGRWLTYSRSRGPELGFRAESIVVKPASGGAARDITTPLDRNFGETVWLPDSKGVITVFTEGARDVLWLQPLEGHARSLDVGTVTEIRHLSASRSGALAFVGLQPRHPAERFYMASPGAKPRRLTRFNDHLAALETGDIGSLTWRHGGFEHTGVLIRPPGFREGKQYPLVLEIHGGPAAHYSETFDSFHELLAAQGWLVFCPNYRGSDTAGDAYRHAIVNDSGAGPAGDVMAGVDAVKALGIVDDRRIAVSGWSYGGYMTTWLTAHHSIWRAAVAGAAVTDFVDQYNLSDLNAWFGYGLGGSPWVGGNLDAYRAQSPITYAHLSRTPTLILAVTGDRRVPIGQSYKLYRALKDNAVPVKFVAYPGSDHFPEDPVQQRDIRRRWLEWIAGHFDEPPFPQTESAGAVAR